MRKDTKSWILYDFANSAFATVVMAGFFPIFFKEYISVGTDATTSTAHLGFANSIASLIVVLIAPLMGAIADSLSYKKKFLFFFTYLGILMTASLSLCAQTQWEIALFIYILGILGFSGANIFYDSLLPFISNKKDRDLISGLGFSLGYLGGGLLFAFNIFMYQNPEIFGLQNSTEAMKVSFILVALWWVIFSLPIFLFVNEPKTTQNGSILKGYRQLVTTFKKIKSHKSIVLFLFAYWFYIDGVDTIIRMAVDYGIAIGFEAGELIIALLIVQFIGVPSTIIVSKIAQKWDTKKTILSSIVIYFFITAWASLMQDKNEFYAIAILIGLVQGGIQALSRSFYSRIIPTQYSAEFFGFYNMIGKFAAVLGPVLISATALITKDSRLSIFSVAFLFIIGFFLLLKVDETKAKEELDNLQTADLK